MSNTGRFHSWCPFCCCQATLHFPQDRSSAVRRGRNRRKNVGSVCLRSECFHSLLLQGAPQLLAKKSQKIRNFRAAKEGASCSSAGFFPLVLDLGEEFLPPPGHRERAGRLFQCISSDIWWVWFSVKHAHRGWYVLIKSHSVSNAVCVSSMIPKAPQPQCR